MIIKTSFMGEGIIFDWATDVLQSRCIYYYGVVLVHSHLFVGCCGKTIKKPGSTDFPCLFSSSSRLCLWSPCPSVKSSDVNTMNHHDGSQVGWDYLTYPTGRASRVNICKGKLPPNKKNIIGKKKNIVYKPFVFLHQRQFVFALLPVEPASKKHQVTYIARGVVLVAGCCPLASRKAQLCLTKNLLSWFWSKATVCFLQREAFCAAVCPPLGAKTLHGFWQKKCCCCCSIKSQLAGHHLRQRFFKLSLQFPLPAFCHDLMDNDLFPQHSDRLNTSNLMRWIAGISDL